MCGSAARHGGAGGQEDRRHGGRVRGDAGKHVVHRKNSATSSTMTTMGGRPASRAAAPCPSQATTPDAVQPVGERRPASRTRRARSRPAALPSTSSHETMPVSSISEMATIATSVGSITAPPKIHSARAKQRQRRHDRSRCVVTRPMPPARCAAQRGTSALVADRPADSRRKMSQGTASSRSAPIGRKPTNQSVHVISMPVVVFDQIQREQVGRERGHEHRAGDARRGKRDPHQTRRTAAASRPGRDPYSSGMLRMTG